MRGRPPVARRLLPPWCVGPSLSPKAGRDEPPARGHVVAFRLPARGGMLVARRRPSAIPASVVWFERRRITTRRRRLLPLEWIVVAVVATALLALASVVFDSAGLEAEGRYEPGFLTAGAVTVGSAEYGGGDVSNEERSP